MLTHRILGIFRLHVLIQGVLVGVLFWVWFLVMRTTVLLDGLFHEAYFRYGVVAVASVLIEALTRTQRGQGLLDMGRAGLFGVTLKQLFAVALGLLAFLVFSKDQTISRVFLSTFLLLLFLLLAGTNQYLPHFLAKHSFGRSKRHHVRTLVAGTAEQMGHFSKWVMNGRALGMRIVGLVSSDTNERLSSRVPWKRLGGFDDIESLVDSHGVKQLLVLGLPEEMGRVRDLVGTCERRGVRFLMLNDLSEKIGRRVSSRVINGMNMMLVYEEPLEDPLNRAFKRVLDIFLSSFVLATVLPTAGLLVWIVHRLQSKGPLLYSQERSGLQGDPFRIWKFRSLHTENHDENSQVTNGDPRVFPAGKWLRKFCIDELPQFWNVLLGDMSLVGPRPHLIAHDDVFARVMKNYKIRSFVKPGITGLAQVSGFRGETQKDGQIIDRVRCDISYLENWSLFMDLRILFLTIFQVAFPPKSAY